VTGALKHTQPKKNTRQVFTCPITSTQGRTPQHPSLFPLKVTNVPAHDDLYTLAASSFLAWPLVA
jgi:hypothetical protein